MVISDQGLTRRQCLITAATSSWMSSFFAMSSTCCRVSSRGSGLLSLTPARDSLGEVKSWKGRPRSLSEELKWKLKWTWCRQENAGGIKYFHVFPMEIQDYLNENVHIRDFCLNSASNTLFHGTLHSQLCTKHQSIFFYWQGLICPKHHEYYTLTCFQKQRINHTK